ncbi:hypothetical protein J6590_039864 [Homalodisca vitripennis]|nr:hypothetical protein J6590_039864 [Homalodisca vitripennis]
MSPKISHLHLLGKLEVFRFAVLCIYFIGSELLIYCKTICDHGVIYSHDDLSPDHRKNDQRNMANQSMRFLFRIACDPFKIRIMTEL